MLAARSEEALRAGLFTTGSGITRRADAPSISRMTAALRTATGLTAILSVFAFRTLLVAPPPLPARLTDAATHTARTVLTIARLQ